jgi:hypothetical protein
MELRNREGTEVDPIPFLVTGSIAFLLLFAFAPGYLLSLGLTVGNALVVTSVAFVATLLAAYHQLVYDANPIRREEVPGAVRFRRLVYVVLIATMVMLLLLIPIVAW